MTRLTIRISIILALFGLAAPAAAQLTGGLEGMVLRHVIEADGPCDEREVVAEVWSVTKTGALYVRGAITPAVLDGSLTMRSSVYWGSPPLDARALWPSVEVLDGPRWLKRGHVWSRPSDGVADSALKLVIDPKCTARCAILAIEHYRVVGGQGPAAGPDTFVGVDRWPLEAGDRRTVYAPR